MSDFLLCLVVVSTSSEAVASYRQWLPSDQVIECQIDLAGAQAEWFAPLAEPLAQATHILLDLAVPSSVLRAVLTYLGDTGYGRRVPIVVLGENDAALAVQALKAGATDYLVRSDLTYAQLEQAIAPLARAAAYASPAPVAATHGRLSPSSQRPDSPSLSPPSLLPQPHSMTQDLRQQAVALELINDMVPALLSFIDADQRYRFNNQRYEDWFGRPATTMYGQHLETVLGTHNYRLIQPYVERALAGERVTHECQIQLPSGLSRHISASYVPHIDADGQVLGFVVLAMDISDRVQSEDRLRRSEDRLRMALESGQLGTWDWNLTTNQMIWDKRCKVLFGVPLRSTVTIERFYQLLHPDDRDRAETAITEAFAANSDGRYEVEYRVRRLEDQQERWILAKGQAYFEQDGTPKRFIGTVLDISQRKQAETALRESEERLQMALDGSGGGYWDWNIVTGEDHLSAQWLEMLGYEVGDLANSHISWMSLIHPEDKPWVLELLAAHLQDESVPYKFEYRLLMKSGHWKWIANYGRVVTRDAQGKPLRMSGVHYDISDRKCTEERLSRSEDRLRMAMTATGIGTWDCDLLTNQIVCDDRCRAIFNFPPELEIELSTFLDYVHPADRAQFEVAVRQALEPSSGGEYQAEYRTWGEQDGDERWVSARGKVYFYDGSTPARFVGTVLDITERKQVEAERENLLMREQAARCEAERANRIKDEFLAILSHELRSPLNPILGWAKLLQTKTFDAETTTQGLATIERNAKLQTQLIDDLLDVARILRGKLQLELVPVDLQSIVQAAIAAIAPSAEAKSIELRLVLSGAGKASAQAAKSHEFLIAGDPTRLQQIVGNLLSNAIKFTPEEGQVTVTLQAIAAQIQLVVADTGRGISPDFLPYIFESFQQEDVSVTRQFGGLGLGLSIVRYLTEAHAGQIIAESPGEGLGATFTVQFPRLDHPANVTVDMPNALERPTLQGKHILVVDDDDDSRQFLTVVLSQYGADVIGVTSGQAVLRQLSTIRPDLIISDIGMADMDGYALIRQIRALPVRQGGLIPALALTAYARSEDERQALQSGFQKHIAKPVDLDELLRVVTELC